MENTAFDFSTKEPRIAKLLELTHELSDLEAASAILSWDENVYMPAGAIEVRGKQSATLAALAHRMMTSPDMEKAVSGAEEFLKTGEHTDADRALVRIMKKGFLQATALPEHFIKKCEEARALSKEAWQKARNASTFPIFRDSLAEMIDLAHEEASYFAQHREWQGKKPYDIFLDQFEPGLTTSDVETAFEPLLRTTKSVLDAIAKSNTVIDEHFLKPCENKPALLALIEDMLRAMGFDFSRGRQDLSVHPFTTTGLTMNDVRITTRLDEPSFSNSIFSSIHEGGHGLFEQGVDPRLMRTPVGRGESIGMALHESQSRFWENIVGRSRAFWHYWYPRVQMSGLGDASEYDFYRAINKVTPSFIRVDADEVTYNLHILFRFELERNIFAGKLAVDDLPEAWNEAFAKHLGFSGLRVPDDRHGILQDVHWAEGLFGYFPSYALGNMYASHIAHALQQEMPNFESVVQSSDMSPIREWLREKVHRYGALYDAKTMLKMATGEDFNPAHFDEYLKEKFGEIYNVSIH